MLVNNKRYKQIQEDRIIQSWINPLDTIVNLLEDQNLAGAYETCRIWKKIEEMVQE